MSVLIIAEGGVNHNGDMRLAKMLIDQAALAGADVIKFQTFKTELLTTVRTQTAGYQKKATGEDNQFAMLKKLELSETDHHELVAHCRARNIGFSSTPFDLESVDFLASLNLDFWKIPSGEITNKPYLQKIGRFNHRVILSTGMATLKEVSEALDCLTRAGTAKEKITVLHCHTDYPTRMEDVHLRAMLTIARELNVAVGYSDHTLGIEVSIAAAALGAVVIEKHFTTDRHLTGPDHRASLTLDEFRAMVQAIRNIETALGSGVKAPSLSEQANISIARKSIVARRPIQKGEAFSDSNITVKRPGQGISPMRWDEVLGQKASRNFQKDEAIE